MKKPSKANLKCELRINGKRVLTARFMEIVSYLLNRNIMKLDDDYYQIIEYDWKDNDFKIKYNKIYADFKKLVGKEIELITL